MHPDASRQINWQAPWSHLSLMGQCLGLGLEGLMHITAWELLHTQANLASNPYWDWPSGRHWPPMTTTVLTDTDHKAVTDHYWPLQTTTDHQRALLTITDPWWPMLLTTIDHYWPLQTTTDDYRPPKSTTDHHWPLMTNATDHYKPPVTTTDYYRLLLTTTDHHWPLQTTKDHYWSLQTTTDHYRASLTTTDYYWPRSPCAEHLVWVQSAPLQGLSHAAELTPAVYSTPAVWTCEKTLTSCQMHSTAPDVSTTDRQTHYNNTDRHTNSPLTVHNHTFSTLWLLIIVHYTNTLTYLFTYLHTVTTYEWHILVD